MIESINFESIFQSLPGSYIILLPDAPKFTIIAFNRKRRDESFTKQQHIGKSIFEAFPDSPEDLQADGVAKLTASLQLVLRDKKMHEISMQKYDIATDNRRSVEPKYWMVKDVPVLDQDGEIMYIIHSMQDLTTEIEVGQREILTRQNFEDFFNQASAPFAVLTGRKFHFSYANPAYIELMNNRQLEGRDLLEVIPELEGQPFLQQIRDVLDTGIAYHGVEVPATAHFKGSDFATTRFFNLSYTPFREKSGPIKGVLAYAYDVSEQVAMRKRDHANQLNQQAYDLFMQAPVGICILKEPDHRILLANAPVLEIWGKNSSIIGKPLLNALPEIKGQGFIELLNKVKDSGTTHYSNEHLTSLVRNGNKEEVYINFVYQPYYDADGTINGVMAIATEVTEQVKARKQIEYAEETARIAIESADLGSYEINLLTDEITTSPRFNKIWGIDHTVPRSTFAAFIHEEDRPRRIAAHKESLITGRLFYEARILWKTQSVHWIRVNGKVLYDADRKPVRLLGVIQDITEQRAFTEELTRLVTERTKELQKANDHLEISNGELEQFAYITSHDLQEPLRKIQVFSSILLGKTGLTPEWQIHAEKISAAAKRMGGLISDLLEYARLSQETSPFREVNLNDVLQSVLADFELLITQKNATIVYDELETIEAVPLQINQLFFNLLGNALKFSNPEIKPLITIKANRLSDDEKISHSQLQSDKDYYKISFTDNGIGFSQQYADKIFIVFQRLNQQSNYSGYGIGLALCNKVAVNHNGIITAEGSVDNGATFTVILPCVQDKV